MFSFLGNSQNNRLAIALLKAGTIFEQARYV